MSPSRHVHVETGLKVTDFHGRDSTTLRRLLRCCRYNGIIEPMQIRPDRAAKKGRFCIWLDINGGAPVRLPDAAGDDIATEEQAKELAAQMVESDEMKGLRFITTVYNDAGMPRYRLEPR